MIPLDDFCNFYNTKNWAKSFNYLVLSTKKRANFRAMVLFKFMQSLWPMDLKNKRIIYLSSTVFLPNIKSTFLLHFYNLAKLIFGFRSTTER